MEYRRLRLPLLHNASQWARNGLLVLLWLPTIGAGFVPRAIAQSLLSAYQVHPVAGPCVDTTKAAILYTGKTYGYLRANDDRLGSIALAFDREVSRLSGNCPHSILVGIGENLAPEYGSRIAIMPKAQTPDANAQSDELVLINTGQPIKRLDPQWEPETQDYWRLMGPWSSWIEQSPAVRFFLGQRCKSRTDPMLTCLPTGRPYDALVPGQIDFYFGADFLAHAGAQSELPMLGANLTIQNTKQLTPPQPTCAQPQLLLPTQVSLPIQSSGSGGGKGKSGKGGGAGAAGGGGSAGSGGTSGSSQGSSSSASGQSGSGQPGQTCLQPETPGSGDANALKLVSPSADSLYPWSSEFRVTMPDNFTDINGVFLCPWNASRLALKDDAIDLNKCVPLLTPSILPKPNQSVPTLSPECKNEPPIQAKELPKELPAMVCKDDIPIQANGLPKDPSALIGHSLLLPDTNIQLCATRRYTQKDRQDKKKVEICTNTPLVVQRPFFPRAWVIAPALDKPVSPNVRYAIFGALDPAITGLIPPENSSFGDNDKYTSQIKIPDPAPALEQLRVTFQRLNADKPIAWTYVLLAQMPRSTAQALSASLQWNQDYPPSGSPGTPPYHFDVVFRQHPMTKQLLTWN